MARCYVPPVGWFCTREGGHEGPCAAEPMGAFDRTVAEEIERVSAESLAEALQQIYAPAIVSQLNSGGWLLDEMAAERRAAFEALPRHRRALVVARRRLRRSWAGRAGRRVSEAWGVLVHGLPEPW